MSSYHSAREKEPGAMRIVGLAMVGLGAGMSWALLTHA
jgi:hypothetical protein